MMYRIKLLGSLAIEVDGRSSRIVHSAKGMALLAYLIYTNDVQSREKVADLLWEASSTKQSLMRLRELLARVRKWLPELQTTRQTVSFQATDDCFVDLWVLRQGLATADTSQLDDLLQLYEGDFLADFHLVEGSYFNEWLVVAREQLRVQVLAAYERLCQFYAESEAWGQGVAAARRWVALTPFREEAHRWLMQMLAQNGQITAAWQAYDACCQILEGELGVEPEAETVALAEQLSEWGGRTAVLLATTPPEHLKAEVLSEPGQLPTNAILPYQRNQDFVGRTGELLHLAHLLGEGVVNGRAPVIAITGMGGLGKTQTAVEFCYRYGRYFSGGVFWLSFAQAENVAEEVALIGSERGLSVYQEAEQLSLADRVNRVQRTWQEPIPRLLIFDNCEDDLLLKEWLPTTGGCYILLTSRRAEWPRELNVATLSLQVLRRPDSIRLLQHLAPNVGSDEADEVASEVGDLPLAIHLAGGFLHRYQQVSPSQYLSQLRDKDLLAHPSLQGHGLSHSPTGHALHVARTFALSLEQLSLQDEVDRMAQRLLLHVACFAPGEPLAQKVLRATAVDEADLTATLLMTDSLKRLVALGFLEADGQESVVMHRLLVSFVVKEFGETEMGQARTAVANSLSQQLTPYLHQAFQAGLPPVSPPQLRHMTDTALAHGMATAPWLTLALGRYLREVGEYAAAQSYLERGLQVAGDEGDFYTRGRLLAVLARAYYSQGFHRQAHQQTLEAERLLRLADVPQQQWLIRVLLRRGWAGLRLGQAQPALAAVNEAWQLSIAADDLPTSASCLNLMGSIHFFLLGEYKKADDYFEQAKVAHQLISDPFGEATIFLNLGECANAQGDYQRAKANMQEALAIIRRIGNRMRELSILTSLGEVLVHLGEYETAVTQLTHVITEAPADWTYAPIAYHALAEAYLGRGQVAEALRAVQMADALDPADDPFVAGIGWRVLGQIAAEQGELVVWTSDEIYTAEACFARSLQIFTEIDNQRERAIVLWLWAEYDLAHGDKVHGKQLWPEAQEIFIRLKLPLLIRRMNEEL